MRNVTVAAVQMKCSKSVEKNIAHAEELVRQAAAKGAEIVLLPELFERPYFCQERRYEYYEYAQTVEENPAVRHFSRVAAELGIVIPVSFYEKPAPWRASPAGRSAAACCISCTAAGPARFRTRTRKKIRNPLAILSPVC